MVYFRKMIRMPFIALLLSALVLPLWAEVIRSADVLNERTRETFTRQENVEIEGMVQTGSDTAIIVPQSRSGAPAACTKQVRIQKEKRRLLLSSNQFSRRNNRIKIRSSGDHG